MSTVEERIKVLPRDKLENLFHKSLEKCRTVEGQAQALQQEQAVVKKEQEVTQPSEKEDNTQPDVQQKNDVDDDTAGAENKEAQEQERIHAEQVAELQKKQNSDLEDQRANCERECASLQASLDEVRGRLVASEEDSEVVDEGGSSAVVLPVDEAALSEALASQEHEDLRKRLATTREGIVAEKRKAQDERARRKASVEEQLRVRAQEAERERAQKNAVLRAASDERVLRERQDAEERVALVDKEIQKLKTAVEDTQEDLRAAAEKENQLQAEVAAAVAETSHQASDEPPAQQPTPPADSNTAEDCSTASKSEEIDALEKQQVDLENRIQALKADQAQKEEELNARIRDARQKVSLLDEHAAKRKTLAGAANLRRELETRRNYLTELEKNLADLYSNSTKFEAEQTQVVKQEIATLTSDWKGLLTSSDSFSAATTGRLTNNAEWMGALSSAASSAFQRILEDKRERVRALGNTNKVLQAQLQETKAEGKAVVSEFSESRKDTAQNALDELEKLQKEVEDLKRTKKKDVEFTQKEQEKLQKYEKVIQQADAKLKVNQKKCSALKEQLQKQQEEHVAAQMELDRAKHAGQELDFDHEEVLACVEVPVRGTAASASSTSSSTTRPKTPTGSVGVLTKNPAKNSTSKNLQPDSEIWCLLKHQSKNLDKTSTAKDLAYKQSKCWWRLQQLEELLPKATSTTFPVPLQTQYRQLLEKQEQRVLQVTEVRKEREKCLENLRAEYQKYKKKADTVAKLQQQQTSSFSSSSDGAGGTCTSEQSLKPEESMAKGLEKLQSDNAELRSHIAAVSKEIRELQQGNTLHHQTVGKIRTEILRICDSLAQKSTQQTSFEKKKQSIRQEIQNKEEERFMLENYAVEQNSTRKKALDQEVDILRTLEKNLQVERKTLQEKLASLLEERREQNERTTTARKDEKDDGKAVAGAEEAGKKESLEAPPEDAGKKLQLPLGVSTNSSAIPPEHQTKGPSFLPPNRITTTSGGSSTTQSTAPEQVYQNNNLEEVLRQPTVAWSDLMELRALIRQYEQCLEQEKRDEDLLRQQNDHLIFQLQEIYSTTNLQQNMSEQTQLEYIRNVFRQFLDLDENGSSSLYQNLTSSLGGSRSSSAGTLQKLAEEHEQCIPVLLKFLEFDLVEQEQIRQKRAKKAESSYYQNAANETAKMITNLRGWLRF
ncbi:unnamed protein product [Amoebophrya sp. A120]|nr:unnamed protein product [Amoebophrya sp. A120]|eukprot:GSA120T00011461001.1